MTPDQLIDLLEKAGMLKEESPGVLGWHPTMQKVERFAALVAAAERNKLAKWMIQHSYATGHGDTMEDLLKELEWQIRESERKACAKVCEETRVDAVDPWDNACTECAAAIRARGQV